MPTSCVSLLHDNACLHTAPYSPDLAPNTSTIISWQMESKHGRAHRWQTSLTQVYKTLLSNMTSASLVAVNMFRIVLSIYVFLVYNFFFSLLTLLTGQWRLLSEKPSYFISQYYLVVTGFKCTKC
jgi:hypothetical protein